MTLLSSRAAVLLLCLTALTLGGRHVGGRASVAHEDLFPFHASKPEGLAVTARRRLGPPPPGHPRIVGESRPGWSPEAIRTPGYPFRWNFVGPSDIEFEYWSGSADASGRIVSIAPHPSDPSVCYVATDGGGLWKTVDGGQSWTPQTDELPSLRGGAVTLDAGNPEIVYFGTGDFRIGSSGAGLFRSLDGGATWSQIMTSSGSSTISGLAKPSGEAAPIVVTGSAGILRSVDGGVTFTRILSGAVTSLWASPGPAARMYAGVRSFGVYTSVDQGATWTKTGLGSAPSSGFNTVHVAACGSNPDRVYAAFIGSGGATRAYRSLDAGATWAQLAAADDFCTPQCWYDAYVAVHPDDPDRVFLGGVDPRYGKFGVARSTDGGFSWSERSSVDGVTLHPDHHTMAFGPAANGGTAIWEGNDGGVWRSTDGGDTWENLNNGLETALLYTVAVHPTEPERMLGGSQDNGTPERETDSVLWPQLQSGDGGFSAFDVTTPSVRYTTYVYGKIYRWDGFWPTDITPAQSDSVAWIAPMVIDPTDPNRLYLGTTRVWSTANARAETPTWTAISGTVTGGGTLSRLAIAPGNPQVIYTGSSSGRVYRTTNRATWSITPVTSSGGVSGLVVSPHNSSEVWVSHYSSSGGRVYRSLDGGVSWTAMATALPSGVTPRALGVDFGEAGEPRRVIMVGSGAGLWHSTDLGASWTADDASFPNANIGDITVHHASRTVTVATYGRGAWRSPLPEPCAGDLDANGEVDASDIGALMTLFGAVGGVGDLDGSGMVDAGDIGQILLTYGACP